MALTSDEEARLRSLLAVLRKARGPVTQSIGVTDDPTRRAVRAIEVYLADLVRSLNV